MAASEIAVGDRQETVLEILGEPRGQMGSSDFQIYYFDRGEVTFREGRVASHTIISASEYEERRRAIEEERQARAQREREAREKRLEEGRALRDRAVTDPSFLALPPQERLTFWHQFRQNYPEIDVAFEHQLTARQAEVARKKEEAKLAEARQREAEERRIAELEQRVKKAENEARLARERRHYPSYSYPTRPPVVIVPDRDKGHPKSRDQGNRRRSQSDRSDRHASRDEFPPGADRWVEARQRAIDYSSGSRQEQFDTRTEARQRAFEERRGAARHR